MTIYGWDASHYDAVPKGAEVVAEGFAFMTHKAGGDKNDAELAAWWKAMKPFRDKVLLGAYWVLYPGNPTGRADAFLARLDSQCPGWRDEPFILQLDCEIWNGDTSTKPGLGDIRAACSRLKAKMPKLRPIVYASAGQYGNSLAGLGYPLWNARYPVSGVSTASGIYGLARGDGGLGWNAYSGQTPAIWQFTSSATTAGQTTCDANAYRGTLAELTALLAPGWSTDMDLTAANLADIGTAVVKAMQSADGLVPGPELAASVVGGSNPTWTVGQFLRDNSNMTRYIRQDLAALAAAQDPAGLAAALAPLLDGVTADELQTAIVGALKQLAGEDDAPATATATA